MLLPIIGSTQNKSDQLITADEYPINIKYCIDPDWYPYESLLNNEHTGISTELIKLLSSNHKINLQLITTNSWSETIELLKNGQCDLTPMLNQTDKRDQFLKFSEVWYRSPNVLISLKDEPFLQDLENIGNRTLALTEGYRITDYVKLHYPNIKFITVPNEKAGIKAVINNEVDVFICGMLLANNYLQANGYDEVKIAGWAGPEDLLRVGVTHSNQTLLPTINQVIAEISESDRINMHRNWNNVSYIDNTNYKLIKKLVIFFSLALLAGLLYGLITRKLNKKLIMQNNELHTLKTKLTQSNKELLFLTHHDLLTQIYNRHYFNQVINNNDEKFIPIQPVTLIFFDIDHFKFINDLHGHSVGDQVLKSLSKAIKTILTEQHIFVRWGGEEFIILCQRTNTLTAQKLCQQIKMSLLKINIQPVDQITCSFGIAELLPEESILQCIERADQAMYQAKSNGRNQTFCAESK